jgi:hypothetical protein
MKIPHAASLIRVMSTDDFAVNPASGQIPAAATAIDDDLVAMELAKITFADIHPRPVMAKPKQTNGRACPLWSKACGQKRSSSALWPVSSRRAGPVTSIDPKGSGTCERAGR